MHPGSASQPPNPPPMPKYPGQPPGWNVPSPVPPARPDRTALIIVLVVVVVVGVPMIMTAVLYGMGYGRIGGPPGATAKPTVVLIATNSTISGAVILVVGVQPAISPLNYRVNLQVGGAYGAAQAAPATPGGSTGIIVGGGTYVIVWQNPGGSGMVSQGDHFVVTYPSGADAPPGGTGITFYLIWHTDGSVLTQVSFTVPTPKAKPTITMTVTKITGGVSILVAGIQPPTSPTNFKVNIENMSNTAVGTAVPMPQQTGANVTVTVSGVTFTIMWNNVGGSGVVTQGDYFVVTYTAAVGTAWAFLLIWSDGSVLPTNTTWQV